MRLIPMRRWIWLTMVFSTTLALFGADLRLARAAEIRAPQRGSASRAGSATPTEFRYPSLFPSAPTTGPLTHRIVVDLSEQQLIAFEGLTPVRAFPISSGDEEHPTLVGRFSIRQKYEQIDLIGRDYYYRDVPYVMAFARPFYIHAAPWQAEFGAPGSRGCVTLSIADARWLFDWAETGTALVIRW
jgi:hypothetical protein